MGVDEGDDRLADRQRCQLVDEDERVVPSEIADRHVEDRTARGHNREIRDQIHPNLLQGVLHAPSILENEQRMASHVCSRYPGCRAMTGLNQGYIRSISNNL